MCVRCLVLASPQWSRQTATGGGRIAELSWQIRLSHGFSTWLWVRVQSLSASAVGHTITHPVLLSSCCKDQMKSQTLKCSVNQRSVIPSHMHDPDWKSGDGIGPWPVPSQIPYTWATRGVPGTIISQALPILQQGGEQSDLEMSSHGQLSAGADRWGGRHEFRRHHWGQALCVTLSAPQGEEQIQGWRHRGTGMAIPWGIHRGGETDISDAVPLAAWALN